MPQTKTTAPMIFKQQADAYLSQANPVSGTLYEVLPTTRNVRIINLAANVVWGVTQPTPLEIVVTIDGQTLTYSQDNPVSTQNYIPNLLPNIAPANGLMRTTVGNIGDFPNAFMFEGRSVRVQVRITWAVTQPTPLVCRVKYAQIP